MTSPAPDWLEQARRFLSGSGLADALAGLGADRPADHAAECRWCPLCAGLAALRSRRPDLIEGLADVLATAATVLRAQAAAAADPAPAPAPEGPAAADEGPRPGPEPGPVQRIDVA